MNKLLVSIIIPCRNEEKYIGKCLESILKQDYPKDKLEILVADGESTDKTSDILQEYTAKYPSIRWFENLRKIVSTGLNILIAQAKGEIIVRMDAHNQYPQDYVSKCIKYLDEYKVDNVGGVLITKPGADTLVAKAIATAVSCSFGIGNADYRLGVKEPKYVDTVPFGCFRRDVFDKVGLFDEELVRSQDCELNHRILKSGGKILLVPDIVSYYHARETFGKLAKMYSQYGYFKALTGIKLQKVLTVRQLVPAVFISSLIILAAASFLNQIFLWLFLLDIGLYLAANLAFSAKLSFKSDPKLFPFLIWSFIVIHFSFGFHYLRGILDFWLLKKHLRHKITDVPLTR